MKAKIVPYPVYTYVKNIVEFPIISKFYEKRLKRHKYDFIDNSNNIFFKLFLLSLIIF
jgi:hypothetical protein